MPISVSVSVSVPAPADRGDRGRSSICIFCNLLTIAGGRYIAVGGWVVAIIPSSFLFFPLSRCTSAEPHTRGYLAGFSARRGSGRTQASLPFFLPLPPPCSLVPFLSSGSLEQKFFFLSYTPAIVRACVRATIYSADLVPCFEPCVVFFFYKVRYMDFKGRGKKKRK